LLRRALTVAVLRPQAGQDGAMTTQEQRWANDERTLDVQAARRVRRTPGVVIGITGLLVLAVGLTAAVDLRRLQTPRGAALAWSEAATFGDCRAFLQLSRPTDGKTALRTDADICRALRKATEPARNDASRIAIRTISVALHGRTANVVVEVRRPDGDRRASLALVRRGNDWLVLRDADACSAVACP
jgi:hypothetical protein